MEDKLIYRGTKVILQFDQDGDNHHYTYMLVDCHEQGFVFQIIPIDGYYAGSISGLITNDPILVDHIAVSYKHLIKEIKRNFKTIRLKDIQIVAGS
jgi:hypothetical protein